MMSMHLLAGKLCSHTWSRFRPFLERCAWPRSLSAARIAVVARLMVFLLVAAPFSAKAVVVTDDFSDLNDTANPTWTHLDNEVGSTGQTWDASTGQYHLTAPSNGTVPGVEGYGFVGSYTGPMFTDVRVTADVVDFPNTGPFGSWFGIAARLNGANNVPMIGDGTGLPLRGYSYQYESTASGGDGEMVLNLMGGGGLKDIRSQKGSSGMPLLDNSKDYRLVLEVIGNSLHGQVLELDGSGNVVSIVAEQWRDVAAEPIGNIDDDGDPLTPEVPFDPSTISTGYSGTYGVGYVILSDADFTIDNFKTETAVAGDYNRNGVTDAADYVLWRKTLGNTGPTSNPPTTFNDMRANGAVSAGEFSQIIDQADYNFWRSNFGLSASGSGLANGSSVPEPATAALVLLGLAGLACRRWAR